MDEHSEHGARCSPERCPGREASAAAARLLARMSVRPLASTLVSHLPNFLTHPGWFRARQKVFTNDVAAGGDHSSDSVGEVLVEWACESYVRVGSSILS